MALNLRGEHNIMIMLWTEPEAGTVINVNVLAEEGSLVSSQLTIKPVIARRRALDRLVTKDIFKEPRCDSKNQASCREEAENDEGVGCCVAHGLSLSTVIN
jgi:hypothetical protein